MGAKAIAAAAAEREANLRKMHVVVPPGEESKVVKCPICKEQLDTQFLEDDEEWVWRNAITVKGKVRPSHGSRAIIDKIQPQLATKAYHATCHADALSSQTAARLRDQTNQGSTPLSRSRSRSGTPEPGTGVKIGSSPLRRDHTLTPPPLSTSAPITTGGTKRKSPSRDENENEIDGNGKRSPSLMNLNDGSTNVKMETSDDHDHSQPSKRLRTSPPPPAVSSS
jgi:pre-mRNA cleavage complex 2 protein Pcf11